MPGGGLVGAATGGITLAQALVGICDGRLNYVSTTQIAFERYRGNNIEVNGELVSIGASGLACNTTDNLISATGTDSGGAMAAGASYHIYVSNASATYAASSCRGSSTAPTSFNGARYLGTSGNAANWRYVGAARTIAGPEFVDSITQRLVLSWYHRLHKPIFSSPGYTDNNSNTTYTSASQVWEAVNGGGGSRLSFMANGEDQVEIKIFGVANHDAAGTTFRLALGIDVVTTATVQSASKEDTEGDEEAQSASYNWVPGEGIHTVDLLTSTGGAGPSVLRYADDVRQGGTSDGVLTGITGSVWV